MTLAQNSSAWSGPKTVVGPDTESGPATESGPRPCFVLGVTSAVYGEGKTTVALNLAREMAQGGTGRVTLVDLNLRNCDLQSMLGLQETRGIVDLLEGPEDDVCLLIVRTEQHNLNVVPAGRAASNPSRLVRSPRLAAAIEKLKQTTDFLVVDMPPILPVPDAKSLIGHLDGLVMVVKAGSTSMDVVRRAIATAGSERVLGVVMNEVRSETPVDALTPAP